jgi:hypothetical protein
LEISLGDKDDLAGSEDDLIRHGNEWWILLLSLMLFPCSGEALNSARPLEDSKEIPPTCKRSRYNSDFRCVDKETKA